MQRSDLLTSKPGGVVAAALLGVALITSGALAKRSALPEAEADSAITEAFAGLVRPTDVGSIAASAAMTIAEVAVSVGDEVAAGQPIARLDSRESERELAQVSLELERATQDVSHRENALTWLQATMRGEAATSTDAPARLALAEREAQQVPMRQAKDSPERAQVAYEQTLLKARRMEDLARAGLTPQQDVEDARFAIRLAADDLANARQAAQLADRVHSAEVAQARARRELSLAEQRRQLGELRAALDQAMLQVKSTQMRYDVVHAAHADPFIRAPRATAVTELLVSAGDRLAAGALIARIARLDPMTVDIDVPPMIINARHVGDTAHIDVPAVGMLQREARIRSIAPLPNDAGKYLVQLAFANPDHARLAGQLAHVRLLAARPARR
jgi:multidrug resistance efflux pump